MHCRATSPRPCGSSIYRAVVYRSRPTSTTTSAVSQCGIHPDSGINRPRTLRALPQLLAAFRTRTAAAIAIRRTLDEHHPLTPLHWYLANLATPDSRRGHGYAAQLITDRLATAPDTAAYLVCTREKNIRFYERFGFTVSATFNLPLGAKPLMWAMVRKP
ncbi:GNAT family N-acetyltransferase [Nocardia iowensis]|uniref:GNAT family N-acetyltransferase n=1 Tax=Nocardia iowensis TaxID=204891 RepID=UPI0031BB7924